LAHTSGTGSVILAGVIGAGSAVVGARVVSLRGPCRIVCHGAEIVSTTKQEQRTKVPSHQLGRNRPGELVVRKYASVQMKI